MNNEFRRILLTAAQESSPRPWSRREGVISAADQEPICRLAGREVGDLDYTLQAALDGEFIVRARDGVELALLEADVVGTELGRELEKRTQLFACLESRVFGQDWVLRHILSRVEAGTWKPEDTRHMLIRCQLGLDPFESAKESD